MADAPQKSTLRFNEDTHRYWYQRRPIPGVTTLLKGCPKPALVYWGIKQVSEFVADNPETVESLRTMGRAPMVNALKNVPWQSRDEAAARGTDVHHLGEKLVHGEAVEVPPHLEGFVDGYVRWLDEFQPTPVLTERPVVNVKWWYAGTFDLIARIGDEVWALDLKTSKGVYGETGLQLAAYMHADFYVDADWTEQPLPKVDRYGVLHVRDGETNLHPIEAEADDLFKHFLHVAYVHRGMDRLKTYIGDPLSPQNKENVA